MKASFYLLLLSACIASTWAQKSYGSGAPAIPYKLKNTNEAPSHELPPVTLVKSYERCREVMRAAKEYQYNLICPKFPKAATLGGGTTHGKTGTVKTYEQCQAIMRSAKEFLYDSICHAFPKQVKQ